MEAIELKASIRDKSGKGPSRRYRMEGLVPAVIYGRGDAAVPLTVSEDDLQKIVRSKNEKHFIKIVLTGEKQMEKISMLKELQYEPLSRRIFHADFYEISMDHKISVDIPLTFTGTPVGVANGGELQHSKRNLKITCLPADLPDFIDVDLTNLNIGNSLRVKDLILPRGVVAVEGGDGGIAVVLAVKSAVAVPGAEEGEKGAKPAAPAKDKGK